MKKHLSRAWDDIVLYLNLPFGLPFDNPVHAVIVEKEEVQYGNCSLQMKLSRLSSEYLLLLKCRIAIFFKK